MADITRRNFFSTFALAPAGLALASKLSFGAEAGKPISSTKAVANTAKPREFNAAVGSSASRRFPNVEVISHEGQKFHFYEDLIKDKIVLITFFYGQCQKFCPPQTANLVKVQKLLGDRVGRDIFMYSLTLKPAEDTPEMLEHYVHMHGIGPGWRFLTGTPENMELLRVKLGFRDPDPEADKDTSNHIGIVLFGNDRLNRWTGCPALTDAHEIIREVSWMDEVMPAASKE
jgi:protein SCO1/2